MTSVPYSAARSAAFPVPQPTSRTRSPARSPAASTTIFAEGDQLGGNGMVPAKLQSGAEGCMLLLLSYNNETIVTLRLLRYSVKMGRPRKHDSATGEALLDAAEQIVENDGMVGLSVRCLANQAGTSTRAVYAVFGSKEGLIVALGRRAFDLLAHAMDKLPSSDDPATDLAEAGVRVFRTLVVDHPALFKIGLQHRDVPTSYWCSNSVPRPKMPGSGSARGSNAFTENRLLGGRTIDEAACQFHALCEGLAAIELRGLLPSGQEERLWRDALSALIEGTPPRSRATRFLPRAGLRRRYQALDFNH